MVPLISSICVGSLGVCQLPRTWWKTVTRAVDLLDPSFPDRSGGLDTWCLEALELDLDEVYEYLRSEIPDYVSFESWILGRKGGRLPAAKVARFNDIVRHRRHIRPKKIEETYSDIGFDPDDTYTSALLLNTLQDWHLFHANDLASDRGDIPVGMPPLVSSLDAGPLDVMQLPRTWYKVLLDAKGLLNEDYPACSGGLDRGILETLGLDQEETLEHLRATLPTYMDFERWVVDQVGEVDRDRIAAFQTRMFNREHSESKRAGIYEMTECDPSITDAVLLNHLEDWRYAYDVAIVPRKTQ